MNLQKINVKLFLDAPQPVPVDALLPIFARWREDAAHPARWVDMADYAHVPTGPGIMMIGHQGNLALDLADPGPGILWVNKADLEGEIDVRIVEVFRRTLGMVRTLIAESGFPSTLRPRPGFWELVFNDRLVTPHTEETAVVVQPAVEAALNTIFGTDRYTLVSEKDPARRYGFTIHSDTVDSLEAVAARL
jgi:hypothetical protein